MQTDVHVPSSMYGIDFCSFDSNFVAETTAVVM